MFGLTQHVQLPQPFEGVLLDPVDVVFVESQLDDVGRQVGGDVRQLVVGQVEQSEVVHVPEGLWVDLGDLVVDQKQTLLPRRKKEVFESEWKRLSRLIIRHYALDKLNAFKIVTT